MVLYWRTAVDTASEQSAAEDAKTVSAIIDSQFYIWQGRNIDALQVISRNSELLKLFNYNQKALSSEHAAEDLLFDLSTSTSAEGIGIIREGHVIFETFISRNMPHFDFSRINVDSINKPIVQVMCPNSGLCFNVVSIPVLSSGVNVGVLTAAFNLSDFFMSLEKSSFSIKATPVKVGSTYPVNWVVIKSYVFDLPKDMIIVGPPFHGGHLNVIRTALNMAAILGGVVFALMQILLFISLSKQFSYIKNINNGLSKIANSPPDEVAASLVRPVDVFFRSELDEIGDKIVDASKALHGLREIESKMAVREAEIKVRAEINENLAEDRKQIMVQMAKNDETTRQELARDLHDEIGSRLVSMRVDASSIKRLGEVSQDVQDRASRIERNCLQLHNFIRASIESLSPPTVETLGFAQSIAGLVKEWQSGMEGRTEFKLIDVETELNNVPVAQATATYRIIQESIANIAKYADASQVIISVRRGNSLSSTDAVIVDIQDNGVGFDYEQALKSARNRGLKGMKERANSFGGTFLVDSHPGFGSRIQCCLPIKL